MTMHKILVHEGATTEEEVVGAILEPRFSFEVLSPLFKNGRLYEIGDTIDLTRGTANAFLELNEIKEIEQE